MAVTESRRETIPYLDSRETDIMLFSFEARNGNVLNDKVLCFLLKLEMEKF